MKPLGKNVEILTKVDIQQLIDDMISESKYLDYKETLNLEIDKKKEEFLKDITAFYNTEGGTIIFGLSEKRVGRNKLGIPILPESDKLTFDSYELLISRINQIVASGTDPAISNLSYSKLIEMDGVRVFAMSIPRNLSIPSMVTFNGSNSFHKRNSADKYMPDTQELYRDFLSHQSMRDTVNSFVNSRRHHIFHPFSTDLVEKPCMLLYSIPLNFQDIISFDGFGNADFRATSQSIFTTLGLGQIQKYGYSFDGLYLLQRDDPRISHFALRDQYSGHVLLFRSGTIELINTKTFSFYSEDPKNCIIYAQSLAEYVNNFINQTILYYQRFNIPLQFYLIFELISLPESTRLVSNSRMVGDITYSNLKFPSFLITSHEDKENALNVIFDILWQTAGVEQCPEDFKIEYIK